MSQAEQRAQSDDGLGLALDGERSLALGDLPGVVLEGDDDEPGGLKRKNEGARLSPEQRLAEIMARPMEVGADEDLNRWRYDEPGEEERFVHRRIYVGEGQDTNEYSLVAWKRLLVLEEAMRQDGLLRVVCQQRVEALRASLFKEEEVAGYTKTEEWRRGRQREKEMMTEALLLLERSHQLLNFPGEMGVVRSGVWTDPGQRVLMLLTMFDRGDREQNGAYFEDSLISQWVRFVEELPGTYRLEQRVRREYEAESTDGFGRPAYDYYYGSFSGGRGEYVHRYSSGEVRQESVEEQLVNRPNRDNGEHYGQQWFQIIKAVYAARVEWLKAEPDPVIQAAYVLHQRALLEPRVVAEMTWWEFLKAKWGGRSRRKRKSG